MHVALSHFGGIVPRLSDHALSPVQATIAHDVKLRNGRIEAWREPQFMADAVSGARSFYMWGCCPESWEDVVIATELAPDWNRLYLTGREGRGLEVAEGKACALTYYKAGVPAPTQPLHAACTEQCSPEADARSYVYTYVNKWGEESAPSPPSNIVRVDDGTHVHLATFLPPPDGYGIVAINIYRATTGFRPADGKVQKPLTDYLYLDTTPITATEYTDTIRGRFLGAVLETQNDRMPPEGMQGVVAIGDQVRLAGFKRNKIFISESFQPHNWPAKYDLTLDYDIVHMKALDQRLFVTTTSIPYIINVSSCDATKCMPVTSVDIPLADIACQYSNAAIITHHGLFYTTQYGIVLLQPSGEWHIITSRWFSEDDWRAIKPSTLRMAYWEGFLFFATSRATFLLNINGKPYGDMEGAELVTLSDHPVDMLRSNTGKLLFLFDDKIWEWDSGTAWRPYVWQSRPLTGGNDAVGQNQSAANNPARASRWWPVSVKLGGSANFRLMDSHDHVRYERFVAGETPRRLPRCGRHLWYKVRLDGTETIQFLDLGTSIYTVNNGV